MRKSCFAFRALLCVTILSLLAAPAGARKPDISNQRVLDDVYAQAEYLIQQRRYLHQHPELSGQEFGTAAYLKAEMGKLDGVELYDVPNSTGFYAVMDTGRPGRTIGLRTDIDALPVQECEVNAGGRPRQVISQNPGVMHACGHDAHMAVLLTAAKVLHGMKNKLNGEFVFLFEQGEENASGIEPMLASVRNIPFDVIYGCHVGNVAQSGLVCLQEGPVLAGMQRVGFYVNGMGGHGSRPDLSVNPVFAAADILTSLNVAWNAQRDITKFLSLGISTIQGGDAFNIIPNRVYVGGSYRFFDAAEGRKAMDITRRVADNVAAAHNCTVTFEEYPMHAPVINDTVATLFARKCLEELIPGQVVFGPEYVWYASETFNRYRELCPTVFALLGTGNQEMGVTAQNHNDKFDIDESALPNGVLSMVQFSVRFSQH